MHRTFWKVFWTVVLSVFFTLPALAEDVPPEVTLSVTQGSIEPGATVEGLAKVTFGPKLHAYQNPQEDPNIIPIELKGVDFELKQVSYPKGEKKVVGGLPDPYYVHSGTIEIPFSLVVPEKIPADGLKLEFFYQQCDDENCFIPGSVQAVLPGSATGAPSAPAEDESNPATGTPGQVAGGTTTAPPAEGLGAFLQQQFAAQNWALLIGALLLVGLAINLTPCVYPLIPVTISYFAGQADKGNNKVALSFLYMVGIAFSYGLVGGIAAATGGAFGQLFQNPFFNIGLGIFMIVLALSMFDLYQIGIPPALSKHLKGRSGPVGSFIMGSLVGVGAAPCAGPVIILLFTEVARLNNPVLSVLSFVIVGVGLGLPYFALGMASNAQRALPKAGGWMKAVKAVMGLAVIYFGLAYFVQALPSVFQGPVTAWTFVAFFLGCAVFLIWWDSGSSDKRTWIIKSIGVLLFATLGGITYSDYQGQLKVEAVKEEFRKLGGTANASEFQKFTVESWEAAKASGKPIFIDATANWCAECQVIERTVFEDPKFISASSDVVLLKIDWSTGVDKEYQAMTQKMFDIRGLPHLVFVRPGGQTSSVLNSLHTVEEFTKEIEKARGGTK